MDGGAFIVNGTDDVIISRNIIRKNGDSGVYFSSSESSITLTNNTITENTADGNGGGIFINSVYSDGVTTLTNNTIIGNKASQNGGGFYLICPEEDNIAYIYNNIIWGNEGAEGGDIYYDSHIYSVANLYNNNFHDIEGSPFTEDVDNIDNDPLLVNPEQGDYHLLADSPCIDKGTANAPELPATDFEGDPRIIGIAPDIGADEYDPTAPPTSTSTTTTIPITTTIALTSTTTILSTTTTPADSTTTTTIDGSCTSGVIYGEHSEETELLRYFRDNVLSQTPEGQELIELYYQWSPVIVKAMEEDEEFKEDIKEMIDGILPLIGKEIE
jgi:parallel beta-helix repeat protein